MERARVEALERQIADQASAIAMAAQSQSNLQALTSEHANLQLVISQLKRALAESLDQCETLEAEGSQLRVELMMRFRSWKIIITRSTTCRR